MLQMVQHRIIMLFFYIRDWKCHNSEYKWLLLNCILAEVLQEHVTEGLHAWRCLILSAASISAMFAVTWCGMLCFLHAEARNDATGDITMSCQSTGKQNTDQCTAAI